MTAPGVAPEPAAPTRSWSVPAGLKLALGYVAAFLVVLSLFKLGSTVNTPGDPSTLATAFAVLVWGLMARALFRSARMTGAGDPFERRYPPPGERPGPVLLWGTIGLLLLNMLVAYAQALDPPSRRLGAAMGAFVFPLLVALLFAIGKRFRIPRVCIQVVFWAAVWDLAAQFGHQGLVGESP